MRKPNANRTVLFRRRTDKTFSHCASNFREFIDVRRLVEWTLVVKVVLDFCIALSPLVCYIDCNFAGRFRRLRRPTGRRPPHFSEFSPSDRVGTAPVKGIRARMTVGTTRDDGSLRAVVVYRSVRAP